MAALAALVAGMTYFTTGCKEKSTIDLGNNTPDTSSERTYVSDTIQTPQLRNVLVEEFTGVSCPPCPGGHIALAAIVQQYTNATTQVSRVKAIGIQVFGFAQANPIDHGLTQNDNRTQDGTDLTNAIYGTLGQTPMAGIDRLLYTAGANTSMYIDVSSWSSVVTSRMALPTIVNMSVTSKYDSVSKMDTIKVKAYYTASCSKKQLLTVAIVEDNIIDGQENGLSIDTFYHHEHVLRDILTSPAGSPILRSFSPIESGRVYERTFVYDLSQKPIWVPKNCKVIAYISNAEPGDKEVQQVVDTHL